MDFSTMNIWYWLILILVGAICGIIGYFRGKGSVGDINNSDALETLRTTNLKLQSDLDACNKKRAAQPNSGENISSTLGATAAASNLAVFDAAAAQASLGKNIKKDDLKVIEGIGPKIEGMFHRAGIETWKALSETSVASCEEILNGGGDRYKVHDPASWPMQAKMCYENKWKELFRWQKEHNHGKL